MHFFYFSQEKYLREGKVLLSIALPALEVVPAFFLNTGKNVQIFQLLYGGEKRSGEVIFLSVREGLDEKKFQKYGKGPLNNVPGNGKKTDPAGLNRS